jgi:sugar lactone lactonase YvrE
MRELSMKYQYFAIVVLMAGFISTIGCDRMYQPVNPSFTPTPTPLPTFTFVSQWGTQGSAPGQLSSPTGLALDGAGDIFVTDSNNNRVEEFTTAGAFVAQWGVTGSGPGQLANPLGIALDGTGNVYVCDSNNNRVQKFTSSGTYLAQWGGAGNGNGQFSNPYGIAVNGNGVYVCDEMNCRVENFTTGGTYVSQFGSQGSGNSQFSYPHWVSLDSQGNVYVSDTYNYYVKEFNSQGTFKGKGQGTGTFAFCVSSGPGGIAFSPTGLVYVCDGGNGRGEIFDSGLNFLGTWGSPGSGPGQYADIQGIVVDSQGYIYTADTNNNRIEKFSPQ